MKINTKIAALASIALMISGSLNAASTYLDLHTLFNQDAFLENGGTGLGSGLDANGSRVNSSTLPAGYTDGVPIVTQDGGASFKFANLKTESLDAAGVNGQTINVPSGQYSSLDLALLDAPNAFAWPFTSIEFQYTDGTKDTNRFGPVAGWLNSPTAFDHAILAATDNGAVTTYATFPTDFGTDEAAYLFEDSGTGNANPWRFVDAAGYVVYRITAPTGVTQATLGITVGNDFVISVATSVTADNDPANFPDRTNGWTVIANSSSLYGHSEHNLANLKEYTFDASSLLAAGTGELYVLLTDATPGDGWGPYIQHIRLYSGTPRYFSQRLDPLVDISRATVYAMFDVGTTNETPYLFDNSASGPSNRGHRYADGAGYLTYKFTFPSNTTNAKLTMDLANNFVVSLRGPGDPVVTYASFTPFTAAESNYIADISCCTGNSGGNRFMDGNNYVVYQFALPAEATTAIAHIQIGNEYLVQVRAGTDGDWQTELSELNQGPVVIRDVDLTPYLTNNPSKIIQIQVGDTSTSDGWGGYLTGMSILNHTDTASWQQVLNSQTLYSDDVHNEYNKGYYTLDLSSALANNPSKQVFVKLTDGSTSDGWGPGVFWMAAYSGELDIQSDGLVFNNLKSTLGEPTQNYGLNVLQRRYPLNAAKTLSKIVLPAKPTDSSTTNSILYLLAATLNANTPAPALEILLQSNQSVRLAWTTNASDYTLQSTPTLTSPQWKPVTTSPTVVGDRFTVTQPVNGTAFYRLTK